MPFDDYPCCWSITGPLFKEIRNTIKIPQDPEGDSKGNGCDDNDALILAAMPTLSPGGVVAYLVMTTTIVFGFEARDRLARKGALSHRGG